MKLSKRTIASRANGARSHGLTTEAGKLRSSSNAMRHGLLSRCVVLECEPKENFEALFQQHIDKFQPTDDVELACIEEMVAATWRLRRLVAIKTNLMNQAFDKGTQGGNMDRISGAFSSLAPSGELALIDRYESRLHRTYQRSLHNLLLMRETATPSGPDEQPDTGQADLGHSDAEHTGADPDDAPAENPPVPNEPTVEEPTSESKRYQEPNTSTHCPQAHAVFTQPTQSKPSVVKS